MTRESDRIPLLLESLRRLKLPRRMKIMNVCGSHEHTISQNGLRSLLPEHIEIIPGPGCPVCICPEEAIRQAIGLAKIGGLILCAYGDMLRVPINAPEGEPKNLLEAKAEGGDVRPVASPMDVDRIARSNPDRPVVFFSAGFETTTAPLAALIAAGVPGNLSFLVAHKLTSPAVRLLVESENPGFDALIAPGHVSTIVGAKDWAFLVDEHHIPTAVCGFQPESLFLGMRSVALQWLCKKAVLDNCYRHVVRYEGNRKAQELIASIFDVADTPWRGVGVIPKSGVVFNAAHRHLDALERHAPHVIDRAWRREMPPGCACHLVVLGKIYPDRCALYGTTCTPRTPVGPCMVSDEGACRIWIKYGQHARVEIA